MVAFFSGEDGSLKGKTKLSLLFHLHLLMSTFPEPGTLFILFTQHSAQGSLRCLPGSLGRNACSFNKTGICGRGNLKHFGYLGHKDLNNRKKPEYTAS